MHVCACVRSGARMCDFVQESESRGYKLKNGGGSAYVGVVWWHGCGLVAWVWSGGMGVVW